MRLYQLSFLLVCFFMFFSMKLPPYVPWKLRVRHFIVTAAIAMLTSEDTHNVLLAIRHPQVVMALFYVPMGFAPAWLYFSLSVAFIILGTIIWGSSMSLAARKPKARPVFLGAWPFYVALGLFQLVTIAQSRGDVTDSATFFGFYVVGTAFIIFVAGAFYLHFRSSSSDVLFSSQPAA